MVQFHINKRREFLAKNLCSGESFGREMGSRPGDMQAFFKKNQTDRFHWSAKKRKSEDKCHGGTKRRFLLPKLTN